MRTLILTVLLLAPVAAPAQDFDTAKYLDTISRERSERLAREAAERQAAADRAQSERQFWAVLGVLAVVAVAGGAIYLEKTKPGFWKSVLSRLGT